MQLFNSLSRQVEEFSPLQENSKQVGFYSCGITAYDYAHIGNLRRYVMDDVLVKLLRRLGYQVTHVQNVTDVGHLASDEDTGEDKTEVSARQKGQTPLEIARFFEDYFFQVNSEIGNARPDIVPRATEHIQEQIDLVKTLEDKGYTYRIEDDGIYFDTSKIADYGYLARLDLDQQQAGARVTPVDGKRHPADFALWKFERADQPPRAMVWPSPWGERTFPGWHTECVAMSQKYLGQQFEIHTGGIDHLTVHHPNEIAMAQGATGQQLYAKYWVHHNFLLVDGAKMSKSKGNCYLLDDIKSRGFSPRALRYLFLTAHYRHELNFTWETLAGAQKAYDRLVRELYQLKTGPSRDEFYEVLFDRLDNLRLKFFEPLLNDLNTAQALAAINFAFKSSLPNRDKYDLILEFDDILGLGLREAVENLEKTGGPAQPAAPLQDLMPYVRDILDQRTIARQNQDFDLADQLRDQLRRDFALEVIDGSDGQQEVRPINPERGQD